MKFIAGVVGVIGLLCAAVISLPLMLFAGVSQHPSPCGSVTGTAVVAGTIPPQVGAFTGDQLTNAAQIITIGAQKKVGVRGQEIGLIAAITESDLHNDHGGDRDSAGLFQMRPSQGWGTYDQVTNTTYAITEFYARLVTVNQWETRPPGDVAQDIEISAFPSRYATHLAQAVQLINALTGVTVMPVSETPSGLTCGTGGSTIPAGIVEPSGPYANTIKRVIAFAEQQLGDPYVLGGAGPSVWDCSGLTLKSYGSVGITIGTHDATEQYHYGLSHGWAHSLSAVQPGDLIFWGGENPYHVAISLGGDWIIAAPQTGETVQIQKIWGSPDQTVIRPVDSLTPGAAAALFLPPSLHP